MKKAPRPPGEAWLCRSTHGQKGREVSAEKHGIQIEDGSAKRVVAGNGAEIGRSEA